MPGAASGRSLSQWLRWQESLHPSWIDLDLGRVGRVWAALGVSRPPGPVLTVAGTNGKGSTVGLLEAFLRRGGQRPGVYTSPHLVRYNERVRVAGEDASDGELISAFERIEAVRADIPLTFFEYGTLAAFLVFAARGCDCWVLEVGMGGRLDAVNVVAADYAIVTTVALDHQQFLGTTVDQIAAEKAGIFRPGQPAFYGDWPMPAAIGRAARSVGARLRRLGEHFDFTPSRPGWAWRGEALSLEGLDWPPAGTVAQLRNISVALAALEQYEPRLLASAGGVNAVLAECRPRGRFEVVHLEREWILDVAHNPQAVATLRAQLDTLPAASDTTVVIGLLGDKDLSAFADAFGALATRWITCGVDDPRARSGAAMAADLGRLGMACVRDGGGVETALAQARRISPAGGRIIVCGSFRVVGPALRWLGIY